MASQMSAHAATMWRGGLMLDAHRMLVSVADQSWGAAGRVGAGEHLGKIMYGEGDSDILMLVESSWEDIHLLAALPSILASLLEELGWESGGKKIELERIQELLSSSSRPWRASGAAVVEAVAGELEHSGGFVIENDTGRVGGISIDRPEKLAAATLLIEGVGIAEALLALALESE